MARASNVFGEPLQGCCQKPVTGFYRNGYCETGPEDAGMHLVCAEMTEEFLRNGSFPGSKQETAGVFVSSDGKKHWRQGAHLASSLRRRTFPRSSLWTLRI